MLFLSVVMGEDDFQTQTWRFFQGLCVFDCKHKWKLWLKVTFEIENWKKYIKSFSTSLLCFWIFHWNRTNTNPQLNYTTELQNRAHLNQTCVTSMGEHLQNHSHDFMIHKKYSLLEHESSWWKQPDPPLKTRVFASLHVCSYIWSLTVPHVQPGIWLIKAVWHLYIEEKCGYNTSVRACFFGASRVYQKTNLYLLCVPSEAEWPGFDAGAVWWCNWWESSEESPKASEEFDYLHPLSAQWAIVRLAICHPFHLHRQHLPCLFMPSRFLEAVYYGERVVVWEEGDFSF